MYNACSQVFIITTILQRIVISYIPNLRFKLRLVVQACTMLYVRSSYIANVKLISFSTHFTLDRLQIGCTKYYMIMSNVRVWWSNCTMYHRKGGTHPKYEMVTVWYIPLCKLRWVLFHLCLGTDALTLNQSMALRIVQAIGQSIGNDLWKNAKEVCQISFIHCHYLELRYHIQSLEWAWAKMFSVKSHWCSLFKDSNGS